MGSMKDLLGDTPAPRTYPDAPGFKDQGTSRDAAIKVSSRADGLRALVLAAIEESGAAGTTPYDVAVKFTGGQNEGAVMRMLLNVRPRFSELSALKLISRTVHRPRVINGNRCYAYVLARYADAAVDKSRSSCEDVAET